MSFVDYFCMLLRFLDLFLVMFNFGVFYEFLWLVEFNFFMFSNMFVNFVNVVFNCVVCVEFLFKFYLEDYVEFELILLN